MICLIVPGLNSSGDDHWQSRWESERSDCRRVELGEWNEPSRVGWIAGIGRAVERAEGCPLLVAHSLGCLAVVWWAGIAGDLAAKVAGALLVAPPDVDRAGADERLRRFAPTPRRPMPFPAIVAASRNDPYTSFRRAREMAAGWSARLYDAGDAGHINAASGLGSWSEGQRLVDELSAGGAHLSRRPRALRTGLRA